jgi:hypothetical protein
MSQPHRHVLVGNPTEVAEVLRTNRAAGNLVSSTRPVHVGHGKVMTDIVLNQPVPVRRRSHRRRNAYLAATATAAAAVAGLTWLLVQLVAWVSAHMPQLVGVGVISALVVAALAKGAARHCPGCDS